MSPTARAFATISALSIVAVLAALSALSGCTRERARPPILFVSIDTLRADRLPDWGYADGATPRLSALVREGIRFENAWAQVPLTLPSHASLLTGRLPPDVGVRSNVGFRFDASRHRTLPALLGEAGYATGAAVSAYVLRRETGLAAGFAAFDDELEVDETATVGELQRPGVETVDAALRWLDGAQEGGERRPWFLLVHLFEPHTPYTPPEPFRSRFADPYDGEIAAADAALGRLLDGLRERGEYERAAIFVFSDHGEGLGDHGEAEHGVLLYREALHVPLILKLPGGERAGERVAAPAALIDLYPTAAALAGSKPPPETAGVSLLALAGSEAPARRIYSETLYPRLHLGWSELRSLADERWHAIDGPDPELYDLAADPGERRNLRADRRREWAERESELDRIPLAFTPPAPASAEELARLAALGYLGAPAKTADGPLPDPKARIAVLGEIQRCFALAHEGRLEESLALCVRLLGEQPDLVDVRHQLADVLRRLGRPAEALEVHEVTARRSPELAEGLAIERAELALDLDRLDLAEAEAKRALAANPLEARLVLATVAGRRGDWKAAETAAREAAGPAARPRVAALLLLAQALAAQGRLEEGLTEAERAATRIAAGAPPHPGVESTRGDLLARLGREGEAEYAFRREITAFPRNEEPYVRLAILLAAERRFDEILPTLEALVAAAPAPRTYELAARTLKDLGNAEAAASFRARGLRLAAARPPASG